MRNNLLQIAVDVTRVTCDDGSTVGVGLTGRDEMISFNVGSTYITRSVCDSECFIRVTVAKRTAKTITTSEGKTLRISQYDGVEQVKPWGSYSMAPIIGADRKTSA